MVSCDHCGEPGAKHTWDMRPCAVGENTAYTLCDSCDISLNRLVLRFFNVADADRLLHEYEIRVFADDVIED